jgi:WD40 repeat protein
MSADAKTLPARSQPKQGKTLTTDRQLAVLRFSPCGKVLAAGCHDATVRRWSTVKEPYTELLPLPGHRGWVGTIAFHSDGRRLFSADSWGALFCWPYTEAKAKPLWSLPAAHDGWVRQLALHPDGKTLASCGMDRVVRLWSAEDGKKVQEFACPEDIFSIAFHPAGSLLAAGDFMGMIHLLDLKSGKKTGQLDAGLLHRLDRIQDVGGVRCLAFDRDGKSLIAAGCAPSSGGFVQGTPAILWFDLATSKVRQTRKIGTDNDGFVHDLHLHTDGFVMAVSSGQPGNGKLFFQREGEAQPFFSAAIANCHSLAVHPDGKRLAVAATNAGSSGNGRLLDKDKNYPGNWSPVVLWDMA